MSQTQLMGLIRQLLPVIGGIAVTFGWLTSNQVSRLTEIVMQIGGPISIIIGVVWEFISRSKASILADASSMKEVKSITVSDAGLASAAKAADPRTDVKIA